MLPVQHLIQKTPIYSPPQISYDTSGNHSNIIHGHEPESFLNHSTINEHTQTQSQTQLMPYSYSYSDNDANMNRLEYVGVSPQQAMEQALGVKSYY